MKKAKKQPPPARDTVDNTMLDLLLDMSSRMPAMEEFVAQHNNPTLTGNQGPIQERSSDHTRLDDTTTISNAQVAAGMRTRGTFTLKVADDHVPETARRELARHH